MSNVATMPRPLADVGCSRPEPYMPGKPALLQEYVPKIATRCVHSQSLPVMGPDPSYRWNAPIIALGRQCLDCGKFIKRETGSCTQCSGIMQNKGYYELYLELVSLRQCLECGNRQGIPVGPRVLDPSI